MNSLLIYWRSMLPKPGLKAGESIPRIETTLKAAPANRALYNGLRKEWDLPDYGVVPPVFPAVATFMTHLKHLSDPKFPFQAMGTIHIRTVIDQIRPLRVDEVVSYRCWVEGHRSVERGIEFDMMTEASVEGKVISTTTMTMYRRGKGVKRDGPRPPNPVHNNMNAHDASWAVDPWTARRYARLTGDINPIHLSAMTAKALGFKGMMLHGMWLVGRACAMHPVQMMANKIRMESEFKLPVLLPANLRYRWWEDGGVLEMRVLDQAGVKPHMIARLTEMPTQ
jgi:acyl dehydratase